MLNPSALTSNTDKMGAKKTVKKIKIFNSRPFLLSVSLLMDPPRVGDKKQQIIITLLLHH
ncbi:MAG: hypothetical protein ACJASB_001867 [Shewanella psychromarinicola]|jgi:hypothetical protein